MTTMWDLYENNLLSDERIHYSGWGGVAYDHVRTLKGLSKGLSVRLDIQTFSRVFPSISCSTVSCR
jgi:hypothetical protein